MNLQAFFALPVSLSHSLGAPSNYYNYFASAGWQWLIFEVAALSVPNCVFSLSPMSPIKSSASLSLFNLFIWPIYLFSRSLFFFCRVLKVKAHKKIYIKFN